MFGAGSSVASGENRAISHHFTWGADLVLFAAVIWLAYTKTEPKRDENTCSRWLPLLLTCLGCIMMLVDPTRHLLLDHGGVICAPEKLAMYADDGGLSYAGQVGRWSSIIGLGFLLVGVLWVLRFPERVLNFKAAES